MNYIDTAKTDDHPSSLIDLNNYFPNSPGEIYRELLAALDMGWYVEEPVYLRPRWHDNGDWVFHFILKKGIHNQPHLITMRRNHDVEQLIFQEGWQVD